jgi:hypothetical protein
MDKEDEEDGDKDEQNSQENNACNQARFSVIAIAAGGRVAISVDSHGGDEGRPVKALDLVLISPVNDTGNCLAFQKHAFALDGVRRNGSHAVRDEVGARDRG